VERIPGRNMEHRATRSPSIHHSGPGRADPASVAMATGRRPAELINVPKASATLLATYSDAT